MPIFHANDYDHYGFSLKDPKEIAKSTLGPFKMNDLKLSLTDEDYENLKSKGLKLSDFYGVNVYEDRDNVFDVIFQKPLLGGLVHDIKKIIPYLYKKFGKEVYGKDKTWFLIAIKILGAFYVLPMNMGKLDSALEEIETLDDFERLLRICKNNYKRILSLEVAVKFAMAEGGEEATYKGWSDYSLWCLHKRLESEGKIPIYKDESLERALWTQVRDPGVSAIGAMFIPIALTSNGHNYDNIKSITPLNEDIAKRVVAVHYDALFTIHELGPIKAMRLFTPYRLSAKVPKRVLNKMFLEGKTFIKCIRELLSANNAAYEDKFKRFDIPSTWDDWILVEWLLKKIKDSPKAMFKTRHYFIHGAMKKYCYWNILDEIQPEDLVNGINTKPDVAFAHSKERFREVCLMKNVNLPVAPFKDTENVKQLKESISLVEEGDLMDNCVSGYVKSCVDGVSFIYHINGESGNLGTMEVDNDKILQLYGPHNQFPEKDVMDVVAKWMKLNCIQMSREIESILSHMKKNDVKTWYSIYNG